MEAMKIFSVLGNFYFKTQGAGGNKARLAVREIATSASKLASASSQDQKLEIAGKTLDTFQILAETFTPLGISDSPLTKGGALFIDGAIRFFGSDTKAKKFFADLFSNKASTEDLMGCLMCIDPGEKIAEVADIAAILDGGIQGLPWMARTIIRKADVFIGGALSAGDQSPEVIQEDSLRVHSKIESYV